ncbi:hypothetical protein CEP54_007511 [Fusarium duplospermum]|uniref:Uncharacterized protein n=1 Tax=Fusarium duplospermum TaxID=1325734 RepID=A0A428Q199_9HYPO|nr:hypothetical protein CEP54_007511 [Fusarium duplospermum]
MGRQFIKDPWMLGILTLTQNDAREENSTSISSVYLDSRCRGSGITASTSIVRDVLLLHFRRRLSISEHNMQRHRHRVSLAESYARTLCKSMGVTMSPGLGCSTNSSSSATGKATSTDGNSLPTESSGTSSDTNTGSGGSSSENSSGNNGGSSSNHHTTHHSSKAGLGAGLGVGLPAAAAIIGAFLYRLRRRKNPPAAPPTAPVLTNGINELPDGSNPPHFQPQIQPVEAYPQAELAAYGALEKKETSQMGVTAASSPVHELPPQHQPQSGMPAYASPPVHELPLTGWQQSELPGSTVPPVHELPLNLQLNHEASGNQPH